MKKFGILLALVLLSSLFGVTKAYATDYYVDNTLGGACAGGAGTSYSTTTRACSASDGTKAVTSITAALLLTNSGTYYVRGGTYATETTDSYINTAGTVTFVPYNDETVTINPSTVTNYLWFINHASRNITFDGGANRRIIFSGNSTKPILYLAAGNVTVKNCVINDSGVRGSVGWFLKSQLAGSLTMSRNLIYNTNGTLITVSSSGVTNFTANISANQMDNISGLITIGQATTTSSITINEYNNTVARGSGTLHVIAAGSVATSTVNFNIVNNIFVLKTVGATNQLLSHGVGTVLGTWNFTNNVLWRESIDDYREYSLIFNGDYSNDIDITNRFVNPVFTFYGTGTSTANLTLDNASTTATNYATGRGLTSVLSLLPSGGDYSGTPWANGSVGCFSNPTTSPNPYPAITPNKVAFAGDSIMYGSGATDQTRYSGWAQFASISGLPTVNTGATGDIAAISGQTIEGAQFLIDRTIFEGTPETVFVAIGINDLAGANPNLADDNPDRALGIENIFEKLIDAGITPIWLGIESKIGNPPDNTAVLDLNDRVEEICATYDMSCGSIIDQLVLNPDWKTDYYANLISDPHPNNTGHLLIAKLAEYLYYPKSTIGTDLVNPSGDIRVWSDGKFYYNQATTTAAQANFSVTPEGGVDGFNSADKSEWLNISDITWTYNLKQWTASSSVATTTIFRVGGVTTSGYYTVTVDDDISDYITGSDTTTCTNGVCQADDNGYLTFAYSGSYSEHTFAVTPDSTVSSAGTIALSNITTTSITASSTGASDTDSGLATLPYQYHNITRDTYSELTAGTWIETGLTPNTTYEYEVGVVDVAGNWATSTSATASTLTLPVTSTISGSRRSAPAKVVSSNPVSPTTPSTPLPLTTNPTTPKPTFTQPLYFGLTNSNVKLLQQFLNNHGFTIATTGAGAPGHETNYFGKLTKLALAKFQLQNKLISSLQDPAAGYLGPKTRALIGGMK